MLQQTLRSHGVFQAQLEGMKRDFSKRFIQLNSALIHQLKLFIRADQARTGSMFRQDPSSNDIDSSNTIECKTDQHFVTC